MLKFFQIKSSNLSASSFFVFFLELIAKIFFICPFLTNPPPSFVVTNGSHAYAELSDTENPPIDQIFGIDFPA